MNVMLDIETLSTRTDALILTIGAVKFSRTGDIPELDEMDSFYRRIEIDSCIDLNLHIDPSTEEWWDQQDEEARYEAFTAPDRVSIKQALLDFRKWFKGSKFIWANSPSFDCVIINNAYEALEMETPWKFWNTRDCRTIMDLAGLKSSDIPSNDLHNALADSYRQVIGVKKAFELLCF